MLLHLAALLVLAVSGASCFQHCVVGNNRYARGAELGLRSISGSLIPEEQQLDESDIVQVKVLGKLDLQLDERTFNDAKRELEVLGAKEQLASLEKWSPSQNDGRITSVRLFEARLKVAGSGEYRRVLLKEFLPIGLLLGKRERSTTRKLTEKHNSVQRSADAESASDESDEGYESDAGESSDEVVSRLQATSALSKPHFPTLLGTLTTTPYVESMAFREAWAKRFSIAVRPPKAGYMWLVFDWDECAFNTLRVYPRCPQYVAGFDYFRADVRMNKRWAFVRRTMERCLQALQSLHRGGYCHNALLSESLWMSTFNQLEFNKLYVRVTDLGASQSLSRLGPGARDAVVEDLYQLGFIFLELIVASFSEDNSGARSARALLRGEEYIANIFERRKDISNGELSQVRQKEWQAIFEDLCGSDMGSLRDFVKGTRGWKDAAGILDRSGGAAWKMVFFLLARGRLYENDGSSPIRVTAGAILREHRALFAETIEDEKR